MHKFTLNLLTISLGLAVMSMAKATPTAYQLLMAQIRLGEDSHREELVEQSLYRLELVEPNNPDVVAARVRYLLRKGDIDGAHKQLARLSLIAPDSKIYKASRTVMRLSSLEGRQALQMARLQAISGRSMQWHTIRIRLSQPKEEKPWISFMVSTSLSKRMVLLQEAYKMEPLKAHGKRTEKTGQ